MMPRGEATGSHQLNLSSLCPKPGRQPSPPRDTERFSSCIAERGEAPDDLVIDDVPLLLNALQGYVEETNVRSREMLDKGVKRLRRISGTEFKAVTEDSEEA